MLNSTFPASAAPALRAARLQLGMQQIQPYSATTGITASLQGQGRMTVLPVPWPISSVKIPLVGFTSPGNGTRVNIAKAQTWRAYIDVISGFRTTSLPVLWGGSATKTLNPGDELSLSDDWCVINGPIPAGAHWWLRWEAVVPTTGSGGFLMSATQAYGGASGSFFQSSYFYAASGGSVDDLSSVGILVGTGSNANSTASPNTLHTILVKYDYLRTCALILGDSRTTGSGGGKLETPGGSSAVTKALNDMGIPYINYGFPGTTLQGWSTLPRASWAQAAYATDVIVGFPINDILANRTLTQIQGYLTTLIGHFNALNPDIRIWLIKPEPCTTSSDTTWNTTAVQTPVAGCELVSTSTRSAYMTWLDTLKTAGTVFGVLDANVVMEYGGSGASAIWTPRTTNDGTHCNDLGYLASSHAIKTQFIAQGGIPNFT